MLVMNENHRSQIGGETKAGLAERLEKMLRRAKSIDFRRSDPNTDSVRRIAGSILLMAFLFAGSGLASYVHQLDHLGEAVSTSPTKVFGTAEAGHDESNCSICLNLHAPALAAPTVITLIGVGIFIAFLTQLAPLLLSQRTLARIDCRGPPAR